jgi:hypothetical protein
MVFELYDAALAAGLALPATRHMKLQLHLANGSRLVALPEFATPTRVVIPGGPHRGRGPGRGTPTAPHWPGGQAPPPGCRRPAARPPCRRGIPAD